MLELARSLIERADIDDIHPIPVIFNLSSWTVKQVDLSNWLEDELNSKYDVPRKVARAWIKQEAILPLLDGLDEVQAEHRAFCVEAINTFREVHGLLPMAICSRKTEYDLIRHRLRMGNAILLQPLTLDQINSYLRAMNFYGSPLWNALQENKELQELASVPY